MADMEKMQRLFDAALRAPEEPAIRTPKPFLATAPAELVPQTAATQASVAVATSPASTPTVVIHEATAAELATLLDDQHKRKASKRRRDALVTLVVLFAIVGGSYAWFVRAPERVQAYHEAMKDFRSIGDIGSIVSKYQESLKKVSVRSNQIEQSTGSLGVSANANGEKDPYFNAEMKQMTGGEGQTTGQRNQMLQQKFGDMQK